MKVIYFSIFTIFLVLLSGLPLISGSVPNYANAKYANTQTQANANECDNGTNCAINSPQTQGDGSASSPTNLQISKFNEDQEQGVGAGEPPNGQSANLIVRTTVICPKGFVCPIPDQFTMSIERFGPSVDSVNPRIFLGSSIGTNVIITFNPGFDRTIYEVLETNVPPTPPGLILSGAPSEECGPMVIRATETKTCIFLNWYRQSPNP